MVDDNIRYSPLILSAEDQATFDKENAQDEAQQELLKKTKYASSATSLAPSVTAPTLAVTALATPGIPTTPVLMSLDEKLHQARQKALSVKANNEKQLAAAVEEQLQQQLRQQQQEQLQIQAKAEQEKKDLKEKALVAQREASETRAAEEARQQKEKNAPMEEARRICVGRLSVDYPNFFSEAKSYVKSLEKAQPLTKNESDLQASVENFIISNIPPESLLSVKPILPLSTVPAQESGNEKKMRELKQTLAKGLYEAQLLQYEVEQEYALASKSRVRRRY